MSGISRTPPRRRWFQFILATTFVVVTLFAVWLAGELEFIRQRLSSFGGAWQTAKVKGEWGLTRTTMILNDDGHLKIITEIDDEQIVQVGPYTIDGGRFVSSEIDNGATCDIRLTGDILVLTLSDGTEFVFNRVVW